MRASRRMATIVALASLNRRLKLPRSSVRNRTTSCGRARTWGKQVCAKHQATTVVGCGGRKQPLALPVRSGLPRFVQLGRAGAVWKNLQSFVWRIWVLWESLQNSWNRLLLDRRRQERERGKPRQWPRVGAWRLVSLMLGGRYLGCA